MQHEAPKAEEAALASRYQAAGYVGRGALMSIRIRYTTVPVGIERVLAPLAPGPACAP